MRTELKDDDARKKAGEALLLLWDAMRLSDRSHGILLPVDHSPEVHDMYYHTYRFIGEMLLGNDCPEREVNC